MLIKDFAVALGLTTVLFAFGCDKSKSDSTAPQTATATPGAVPSAVSVATNGAAGVYNALSTVENSTNRRHQQLTLGADMTAELDTDITGNAPPISKHSATGTYTSKADDITVTLTAEDGKPIPASNGSHVMHLTAQKGYKSLLGDDGRTFERAK